MNLDDLQDITKWEDDDLKGLVVTTDDMEFEDDRFEIVLVWHEEYSTPEEAEIANHGAELKHISGTAFRRTIDRDTIDVIIIPKEVFIFIFERRYK